jgi:tripartite-type tricarboxylate transporter receptor subunit TctC
MEAVMLTMRLRVLLIAFTTLAAGALAQAPAQAQLSGRPIKFIVPYPAGGLPDTVARIVGRRLQERLGQTVVIENRPRANGAVAVNALVSSPADGHTFAVTDAAILSINPQIYSQLAYDPNSVAPVHRARG